MRRKSIKSHHNENKWKTHCVLVSSKCKVCGRRILFYWDYDATFCPNCNEWISEDCGNPKCPFCSIRPPTPAHALENSNSIQDCERYFRNQQKQKAIRHFVSNEKHRKRQEKLDRRKHKKMV